MSSLPPCDGAYDLAVAAVASVLSFFTLHNVSFISIRIEKFSNTTKFGVESSTWVLVLSAIGALAGSSVIGNFNCGPQCSAATLACNTLMGTYGAGLVAAFSAICAATLKIASFFHQTAKPQVVNDNDQ
jgi:energy-converting hydrogenase Eha subunit B